MGCAKCLAWHANKNDLPIGQCKDKMLKLIETDNRTVAKDDQSSVLLLLVIT